MSLCAWLGLQGVQEIHTITVARKRKSQKPLGLLGLSGAPGRIRTRDPLVRSQVLYPTELPARETVIMHYKK